jgi:hypothetical protein
MEQREVGEPEMREEILDELISIRRDFESLERRVARLELATSLWRSAKTPPHEEKKEP